MLKKYQHSLLLLLIILVAAGFRLYGLRWDDDISGYPHPDERHLANTMSRMSLRADDAPTGSPINWKLLNDPDHSPLNPRRLVPGQDTEHFDLAYGTLPVYLYRLVAVAWARLSGNLTWDEYAAYGLIGRSVTALFSLLTVLWVYLIGRRVWSDLVGLLAAALLAVCVLHIQLSHFMTVDLLMSAMNTAGLLFCVHFACTGGIADAIGMGVMLGLSMACKFNGITLGAGIAAAYLAAWWGGKRRLSDLLAYHVPLTLVFWVLAFGLFEYFALRDPYTYVQAIGTQAKMVSGETDWPYTRQYVNTAVYGFQLQNLVTWGMGWPLGLAAVGGVIWSLYEELRGPVQSLAVRWFRQAQPTHRPISAGTTGTADPTRSGALVLLGWALPFFIYTARLEVKFLRYMLPLAPILCLFAAAMLLRLGQWLAQQMQKRFALQIVVHWTPAAAVLTAALLWSLAYARVYAQEHPWQAASRWFYQHAPAGSTYTWEAWGDRLPVDLPGLSRWQYGLSGGDLWMHPYHDMPPQDKLQHIIDTLRQADYVILSTPRVYLSVARLPWRYPVEIRYYELLFQEQLGFEFEARFTAWPGLGSFEIQDIEADQSFFDYDHPPVLIFRKNRDLTDLEWQTLFAAQLQATPQVTRQGKQPPVKLPIPLK